MSASELDPLFLKFPPFPEPPSGVMIMPFKDFKPRGIQLFSEPKKAEDNDVLADEEDAELDALGIPTVELRIKHTTDECKSNSRKRRKKKRAAMAAAIDAVPVKKLPWYEEWKEGEDLRVTKVRYDEGIPPVDRFLQSAYDFRTGRPWPPIASGLNNLWDQFRMYTGLLVNPSLYRKVDAKNCARAESPDFISDDEDDPDPRMNVGEDTTARPTKRQRSGDALAGKNEESPFQDPHKVDEDMKEEKISIFLSDPEKAMRIFLSSYMREHGLIWSERNLIYMPRLVFFFLAFVVRNRALFEPVYQRGLKRALEMIELAKKELPLTHKVGQSIPDALNEACRECFGRQGGMNWSVVEAVTTTANQTDTSATIITTDLSSGVTASVALPTEAEAHLKDAIEDNVDDMNVSLTTTSTLVSPVSENTTENSGGWGGNGWGGELVAGSGDGGSWGQNAWGQDGTWGDSTREGQDPNPFGFDNQWAASDPSWIRDPVSLFSLLGPSAFPLTHTTGIIELSTRRVSAVHFPPNHPKGVPLSCALQGLGRATMEIGSESQGWTPSPDGVEAELDARFAKVVLEPWGREEGDIGAPEIWRTSRGPVVDPSNGGHSKKAPSTDAAAGKRKPHNPLTDNITLLVEPSFAETLSQVPGLGLGAMWIEIARQERGAVEGSSRDPAQVDYDTPGRFWYHEDVTGIFPSFYTPGPSL